jgi:hypothetical protein
MRFFSKLIDLATRGSESPLRRLVAYYVVLTTLTIALLYIFPVTELVFSGERLESLTSTPQLLQDGLSGEQMQSPVLALPARLELVIVAASIMIGSLLLMLPVTWVYMSSRHTRGYDQSMVQTLIMLPIVVAGIVLIVRNSLALAFSLAGIVAGVRFRNTLKDPRDAVFIFLAIGVGLAAGVQALTVAALLSMIFNFLCLMVWRANFGQSVLQPRPAGVWSEPLATLAEQKGAARVPDRDLVLALSPSEAGALADRFQRLQQLVVDPDGGKPRFNAVLWVTTDQITEAQRRVEQALQGAVKRWQLDEVVTNEGKPSELYYLVRVRKRSTPDDVLTAVRAEGAEFLLTADLQLSEEMLKKEA